MFKKIQSAASFLAKRLTANLPFSLASTFLLSTKWGRWHESNGYYKFPVGTKIKQIFEEQCGFGTNPKGKVVGHEDGRYVIEMTSDGTTRRERHSKWNTEFFFARA